MTTTSSVVHDTVCHFELPQELTDMIVDFLHDDVQSLLACALVCRAWLPSSRFQLFNSCTIGNSKRFGTAFSIITTSRDVGAYVRQLTIIGRGRDLDGLLLGTLETLLRGLPHLRRLTIQHLVFMYTPHDWPANRRTRLPQLFEGTQPNSDASPPAFALEELQLLECNVTTQTAEYPRLCRVLSLFSSIQKFLASTSKSRSSQAWHDLPPWGISSALTPVAVQHLHTFDIPAPVVAALLATPISTNSLQSVWYDDNVLHWTEGYALRWEVDRFGEMLASLRSHQRCLSHLILGPLPIFENPHETQRGLARLRLDALRGLRTFHLRGRYLEPYLADVFAALPGSVHEARFVIVGFRSETWGGSRNRFRAFAEAFAGELARAGQAGMAFVLDLGVARRRLDGERFAVLAMRAEEGLEALCEAAPGRVGIEY